MLYWGGHPQVLVASLCAPVGRSWTWGSSGQEQSSASPGGRRSMAGWGGGRGEIPEGKGYNESTLQGTWVYVSGRCVTLAINFPSGLPLSVLRSEEGG